MKICLITNEFYPLYGGIGHVFTCMCKVFKKRKERLYIFNSYYKGKNIFNNLNGNTKTYNLKDLFILGKKKKYSLYLIKSLWKIISDLKLKFYFRLNMLLYLLIKPSIFVGVVKNLSIIHPYLKKIKPDLIFISACSSLLLPLGYILSRLIGKKFICSAHGTDFLVKSHYSLKTHYLKAIDKIIVSSNKMKEMIKKINHLDDSRLTIIPYGLYLPDYELKQDITQIKKELHISPKDFIIISVGRHAPRKNFQIVIKAMKAIKEKLSSTRIKYYLIGKGSESHNLKVLTKKFNLEEDVLFLGAVNDVIKNKYLKASDIFIMPSIASNKTIEGFGIVFLEANFFKLPVIGTTSGGIIEAIDHNKSGLLVKPNDLNELVKAILYLNDHEIERKVMGEYGYNRVINNYNWDLIVHKYIKLFKETINKTN